MSRRALAIIEVAVPVCIVAIWYLWSSGSESTYFPPLQDIVSRFKATWLGPGFIEDALPSIERLLIGFAIAVVLGIMIGVPMATWRSVGTLMSPGAEFMRALPPITLIPFGIVAFGIGGGMKIFVIAFGCLFPILLNTIDGVSGLDRVASDAARTMGVSRWLRIRKIVVPSVMPHVFAGMRTSLALALILMVVSEMVASTNGLGFAVLRAQRQFDITAMWAGILALAALGYIMNLALVAIERIAIGWNRGYRKSLAAM